MFKGKFVIGLFIAASFLLFANLLATSAYAAVCSTIECSNNNPCYNRCDGSYWYYGYNHCPTSALCHYGDWRHCAYNDRACADADATDGEPDINGVKTCSAACDQDSDCPNVCNGLRTMSGNCLFNCTCGADSPGSCIIGSCGATCLSTEQTCKCIGHKWAPAAACPDCYCKDQEGASCKVGKCGAGCDDDGDCDIGQTCNLETCQCEAPTQVCGNGIKEGTEDCDPGANDPADCCSSTCTYESSSYVCRAATGQCDVEEKCSGTSATCSADSKAPSGTSCNDGQYCSLTDECDGSGNCVQDTARTCDDSISCTSDSCNEGTDQCDHATNDALCNNGAYCDGSETCTLTGCQAGTPIDCSIYDLPPIATCTNNPDDNPYTWDYFAGFTSVCREQSDSCTTETVSVDSSCSISQCSAECENNGDCKKNSCEVTYNDYCDGNKLVEYDHNKKLDSTTVKDNCDNKCLTSCLCEDCIPDCSAPATSTYCVGNVCGAECDKDADCKKSDCSGLNGCYDHIYRTYKDADNTCLADCGCTTNECNVYNEEKDKDGDGYSASCGDCDDNDPTVHEGALEVCGDQIDNNCDGIIDEDCAYGEKKDALETLMGITTTNRKSKAMIGSAAYYLDKSVNKMKYSWIDDTHVECIDGYRIIQYEEYAVNLLMIAANPKDKTYDESIKPALKDLIIKITNADRLIAQTAIDDLEAGPHDDKVLNYAKFRMTKGDFFRMVGRYDKAINEYKIAWTTATSEECSKLLFKHSQN